MSMYGKYPKVLIDGEWYEQNGLGKAPKAWPTTDCSGDKMLTVQAQANETNINTIMKRIEKGLAVAQNAYEGRFEDVSEFNGLEDAIIKVKKANEDFMVLPADIRARFNNDPVELIEFLGDENNRKEAIEMGLIEKSIDAYIENPEPATIPPVSGKAQ